MQSRCTVHIRTAFPAPPSAQPAARIDEQHLSSERSTLFGLSNCRLATPPVPIAQMRLRSVDRQRCSALPREIRPSECGHAGGCVCVCVGDKWRKRGFSSGLRRERCIYVCNSLPLADNRASLWGDPSG